MSLSPESAGQNGFFQPSDTLDRSRTVLLTSTLATGYGISLYQLNELWYKQHEQTAFHFFDDSGEWRDVDKGGHLYAAYFESLWGYSSYRWTGMNDRKAALIGTAWGFGTLLGIEVLDGFSEEWGFSWYDLLSNAAGSGLFLAQQLRWKEQRIRMKFSVHSVDHPDESVPSTVNGNSTLLSERVQSLYGSGAERLLKDYNGQTIWLSINPASFLNEKNTLPSWLNIALGYGADNLYGGFENAWTEEGNRYRYRKAASSQWYLSPDIDLSRIDTNSPFLRTVLDVLNIIKVPLPTLEYRTDGQWTWHWLYF